ncbi:MAG: hypothetical protein M1834_006549 [Cirrosporium novae-zelandiae]|nr:MAG: hypothetical protein M1834_006549 [Cirrosporium novae-zelandiae]
MPFNHISIYVSDLNASLKFYLSALTPLEYEIFKKFDKIIGLNAKGCSPDFWIAQTCDDEGNKKPLSRCHIAFDATNNGQVDEFYDAAIKAGAICNGPPGYRPQYTNGYYAAFVKDPDGNNVECIHFEMK